MSAPPVPPRPPSVMDFGGHPAPPPLPPGFRPEIDGMRESQPHFGSPMIAPRPQKLMSSVPADMARTLETLNTTVQQPQPQQQQQQPPLASGYPNPPPPAPGYPNPPPPPPAMPPAPGMSYGQSPYPPARGASPMPVPPPPPPFQNPGFPQQQPYFPPGGFGQAPPRMGPSPAPPPPPMLAQPGFMQPRLPQPWGASITPGLPPMAMTPQPGVFSPPPLIQPNWVNGATPPPTTHTQRNSSLAGLSGSLAALSFNDTPRGSTPAPQSQPKKSGSGSLTATLPTAQSLLESWRTVSNNPDPARKVHWAKEVFALLDRHQAAIGLAGESGPMRLTDPNLQRLADSALQIVAGLTQNLPAPIPIFVAEALYLKGNIEAAGSFPDVFPPSPRDAFRDFEAAARAGYSVAWFKLGRDYEAVGDLPRAKDCFERGARNGVGSCYYRMGMAHLQGQLGLVANPHLAMQLLQRAAVQATVEVPQPAHVYALLLLGEFPHINLPAALVQSLLPPPAPGAPQDPQVRVLQEARKYTERAAYLGFAPAQFKLGHSYEFATPPFPFDPLMSVQYYSLASQNGEAEADMALSKWFLCGSPAEEGVPGGGFEKDEGLAVVFAEKAAKRGLPTAQFAMGYYSEVGVGGIGPDIERAKGWYEKAAKEGNEDAQNRLRELAKLGSGGKALGRKEHENLTDERLVRSRTIARERSANTQQQQQPSHPAGGSSLGVPGQGGAPSMPNPGPSSQAPPAAVEPPRPSQAEAVKLARAASKIQHATPPPGQRRWGRHKNTPSEDLSKTAMQNSAQTKGYASPETPASGVTGGPAITVSPAPSTLSHSSSTSSTSSGKGPASFAEMGYHSQKLENKDCIIM